MLTLVNFLSQLTSSVYSDKDEAWVQFVTDHKLIIREAATAYTLSTDKMALVRYDMIRLLTELSFPLGCAWMIYVVNDLPSDFDFISHDGNPVKLYVPDMSRSIPVLYTYYQSAKNSTDISS